MKESPEIQTHYQSQCIKRHYLWKLSRMLENRRKDDGVPFTSYDGLPLKDLNRGRNRAIFNCYVKCKELGYEEADLFINQDRKLRSGK